MPETLEQVTSVDYHLIVLIGSGEWQFALLHTQTKSIEGFLAFNFEKKVEPKEFKKNWDKIISEYRFLDKYYANVSIVYRFDEAILLPVDDDLFSHSSVLNVLYGEDNGAMVKEECVINEGINIVYRVPVMIANTLQRHFVNALINHYYSFLLQSPAKKKLSDVIAVDFFASQFTVMVIRKNQLQLIQSYNYSTPEDVLFYLLTIAKEYNCSREDIILQAGGMIEEKSALFTELKKYFLHIIITEMPEGFESSEAFNEFPVHYFNPILTIASCVS
ncbi:MAG: DUF3822 family protein [Sphingobacteriales bacterium]|nr:DUF3822 family protein [Sphingobacteriales bacterium]